MDYKKQEFGSTIPLRKSCDLQQFVMTFTCSWDRANFSELIVARRPFAADVCEASCRWTESRCWCHGACEAFITLPAGTRCSTMDLGIPVPCLEPSAPGTFARVSRGAVGRRGMPGLNSFGERNLGLRTFWLFTARFVPLRELCTQRQSIHENIKFFTCSTTCFKCWEP